MSPQQRRLILPPVLSLLCLLASCEAANNLLTPLTGGIRVIVENNTSSKAVPDIRTSDSDNFFEDLFTTGTEVTDFGDDGAVAANRTVTFYIACDDSLERIAIGEVDFFDRQNDRVGGDNPSTSLRRDSDFDCGDTIRITLTGSSDDFSVDVEVE
jgi:hypothetical protein